MQHWKPQRGEQLAGEGAGCSSNNNKWGSNLVASWLLLPPHDQGGHQLLPSAKHMQ